MPDTAEPLVLPDIGQEEQTKSKSELDPGYLVICWDDPVNLMDYVTHVFQVVFGWTKSKAEFICSRSTIRAKAFWSESLEKAEHYVHQLHKYSLHATMERE